MVGRQICLITGLGRDLSDTHISGQGSSDWTSNENVPVKNARRVLADAFLIAHEDLSKTAIPDGAELVAIAVRLSTERPLRFANPTTIAREIVYRYRRKVWGGAG